MVIQLEHVLTQVPVPPKDSGQLQCRLLRDQRLATIEVLRYDIETTSLREGKKTWSREMP